jgi:hypothetical protein
MVTWLASFVPLLSNTLCLPLSEALSSQSNSTHIVRSKYDSKFLAGFHDKNARTNSFAIHLVSDVLAIPIYQRSKILPASALAECIRIANSATRFFTALQPIVTTHDAPNMNTTRARGSSGRARLDNCNISSFLLGQSKFRRVGLQASHLREIQTILPSHHLIVIQCAPHHLARRY